MLNANSNHKMAPESNLCSPESWSVVVMATGMLFLVLLKDFSLQGSSLYLFRQANDLSTTRRKSLPVLS